MIAPTRHGDVAVVTLNRPPANFVDTGYLDEIVAAVEAASDARAIVLAGDGKHFRAGAALSGAGSPGAPFGRRTPHRLADFAALGFHHGFGMTETLPRVVGVQRATEMFCTAALVLGPEALEIGLCDRLVEPDRLLSEATGLATTIAGNAPLAVASIRRDEPRACRAGPPDADRRLRRGRNCGQGTAHPGVRGTLTWRCGPILRGADDRTPPLGEDRP